MVKIYLIFLMLIFLWAPKKTPDDIVRLIDQTYAKMMKDPDYLDECKKNNVALLYVDGDTVVKKSVT